MTSDIIFKNVMTGLAGLGLFLVAIKLMSSSLKQMTGSKITTVMKLLHKNPVIACLVGVLFTTMIQSSDGAVALAIGLVAAGFLDLKTAIAFILGANIGTATTSIIVAASDVPAFKYVKYSLFAFSFLGAFGVIVLSEEKKSRAAMLFFAIGAIFVGLEVMSAGFKPLAEQMRPILGKIGNPFAALFVSIFMTGVFQSSSAVVTIVEGFYGSSFDAVKNVWHSGAMSIDTALAMVVGANIGTTFTALIASIGSPKRDTKRIAVVWLITNVSMAIIMMPLIATGLYGEMIYGMNPAAHAGVDPNHLGQNGLGVPFRSNFDLAIGHILFNVFLVMIFLPLTKQLVWVANKVIKNPKNAVINQFQISLPQQLLVQSPELAFEAAKKTSIEMGRMSYEAASQLNLYLKTRDKTYLKTFESIHELLEAVRTNLSAYLIEIGSKNISERISNQHMSLILSSRSLDTITRLGFVVGENIKETYDKKTKKFNINDETIIEIRELIKILKSMIKRSYKQIGRYYPKRTKELEALQIMFDNMIDLSTRNHVLRLKNKTASKVLDFENIIKTLSRMSHHAIRINKYQRKGRKIPKPVILSNSLSKELFSD